MKKKERKKLKKMSRAELVDIIYELRLEEIRLKEELAERRIKIESAGSIAEASLSLQDIFNRAQKAADDYLAEVKFYNVPSETLANQIIADAQETATQIVNMAKEDANKMIEDAESEIENQWEKFTKRMIKARKTRDEIGSASPKIRIFDKDHE